MFPCPECGGETKVDDTIRLGWRGKGTLRRIVCKNPARPNCKNKFQTVELPRGGLEETIRREAERRAREMFEAFKGVLAQPATRTPEPPPVPVRCTSPRQPAYKRRRA